jgi:CrcB protein
MIKLLVVGAGGFIGAIARNALTEIFLRHSRSSFPIGTFVINVIGCLLIGALMAWIEDREALTANARLFLIMGLLGSFTTFSTFGYQSFQLLQDGRLHLAMANIVGSALLGLMAVAVGRGAVRLLIA